MTITREKQSNLNGRLIEFLISILGEYKLNSNFEYYFICPLCMRADNKKKLSINLDSSNSTKFQHWHCWRDSSHKGASIFSLLKLLKASNSKIEELRTILKCYGTNSVSDFNEISSGKFSLFNNEIEYTNGNIFSNKYIFLPDEFKSFTNIENTPEFKNALSYIKKRNVSASDIIKYNIGYCDSGKYKGYIILPSYDENMDLNFFVARAYYDIEFIHKIPNLSKNIIFNECHINWNLPIVICEGVWDSIAIKRNSIPIIGKTIPSILKQKILQKGVKQIYICLDSDAIMESVSHIEEFMNNNIIVHFVHLPENGDKKFDPSELGFESITELINSSKPMEFADLIKMKLSL